ncbi:unnamed protein product [Cylindrotheca closterium]|uniref:Uncharacterized protein n=1 Tax=Cylindrotheca closterium TaxID=2856 RepID=A0AAD2JIK8_9STRA|nr:unnamed protein product [Cylindrotheca closterium]
MQAILAETEMDQTAPLCTEAYAAFARYEAMEATSILEMTLWKGKLTSGWSNHDTTKRQALDRDSCRVVCGSDVILPRIVQFLDIPMGSSA